jgi:hypothetical protein
VPRRRERTIDDGSGGEVAAHGINGYPDHASEPRGLRRWLKANRYSSSTARAWRPR